MAKMPEPELIFEGKCPDCGERQVKLPGPLPDVGDDFDWRVRDYDGFRLFMMEQLAARFPERRRWTPGDIEVVIVEVLAAVLDQLSDMADRTATEATLETARRPESVRRLLHMIGYDALKQALHRGDIKKQANEVEAKTIERLERLWLRNPYKMDEARHAGPRAIHTQRRMVTLDDYAQRLEDHPLVQRAAARLEWTGSWHTIFTTVVLWGNHPLDPLDEDKLDYPDDLRQQVDRFHDERALRKPQWEPKSTIRTILRPYLNTYRMVGQEVVLEDAVSVPVSMAFSVRVASNYFRSEIVHEVSKALGTQSGGFFEPGRLRFGEDLHVSDLMQVLMALDGIENVCVNRFKRMGSQFPDQAASGRIVLAGCEIAVCNNDPSKPDRGYYRLTLHGGRRG
ncbi:MAG: hypothetical protein ACYTEL_05695 [Planctomycetota bacterium]|jgi:hypothetical protein